MSSIEYVNDRKHPNSLRHAEDTEGCMCGGFKQNTKRSAQQTQIGSAATERVQNEGTLG